MDGKKKLEELVASANAIEVEGGFAASRSISISHDTIRSISDAYKAMEAERDALRDALQAIMSNHETAGAGASIFQCTTAEVNAARRVLKGSRHEG